MALNKTSYPIHISNLKKTYRGKRGKLVEALRDLSLEIVPGEVFGFLGPNGAGKSTTIKILMGLIRPSGGDASIFGTPVSHSEARRRRDLVVKYRENHLLQALQWHLAPVP